MSSTETRGYVSMGVKTASYSKLSVPGYTKIKYRSKPSAVDHAALKEELLRKEGKLGSGSIGVKRLGSSDIAGSEPEKKKAKTEEVAEEDREEEIEVEINPLDRDDSDVSVASDNDDSDANSGSDDDDDDEEELAEIQRQLERLKREKAEEKARKEREEAEAAERDREAQLAAGNPLIGTTRVTTKKWYEETIFKNQAAGEPQYKKRFLNDTTHNDFHKRFLSKYMR